MTFKDLLATIPTSNLYQIEQIYVQVVRYTKLNEKVKNTCHAFCPVVVKQKYGS